MIIRNSRKTHLQPWFPEMLKSCFFPGKRAPLVAWVKEFFLGKLRSGWPPQLSPATDLLRSHFWCPKIPASSFFSMSSALKKPWGIHCTNVVRHFWTTPIDRYIWYPKKTGLFRSADAPGTENSRAKSPAYCRRLLPKSHSKNGRGWVITRVFHGKKPWKGKLKTMGNGWKWWPNTWQSQVATLSLSAAWVVSCEAWWILDIIRLGEKSTGNPWFLPSILDS